MTQPPPLPPAAAADAVNPVTFAARKVTEQGGRLLFLQAEWDHDSRSFNLLLLAPASLGDGVGGGEEAVAWEATDIKQPPRAEYANWYERVVAALTGLDAESYFTFTLSDEEDSVVLFRWSWHERPQSPASHQQHRGNSDAVADDLLHAPPMRLLDLPKGTKRVGVARLRRAAADAPAVATRLLTAVTHHNEALRRDNVALTRDVTDLRLTCDLAQDAAAAKIDSRERSEHETLSCVVLLMNEKKQRIRALEESLEAAHAQVDDLERQLAGGGADSDMSDDDDDDGQEGDGLGMDTDDEEEKVAEARKKRLAKNNGGATVAAAAKQANAKPGGGPKAVPKSKGVGKRSPAPKTAPTQQLLKKPRGSRDLQHNDIDGLSLDDERQLSDTQPITGGGGKGGGGGGFTGPGDGLPPGTHVAGTQGVPTAATTRFSTTDWLNAPTQTQPAPSMTQPQDPAHGLGGSTLEPGGSQPSTQPTGTGAARNPRRRGVGANRGVEKDMDFFGIS